MTGIGTVLVTSIAALFLAGCAEQLTTGSIEPAATAKPANAPAVQLGMTRSDVIAVLGQPSGNLSTSRNVACMTYVAQDSQKQDLTTVEVVVLEKGKVVRHAKSAPFDAAAPGAIAKAGQDFACKV